MPIKALRKPYRDSNLVARLLSSGRYSLQDLIAHGLDLNHAASDGRTLLLQAIRSGQSDVAIALLNHGAKHRGTRFEDRSPLGLAVQTGQARVVAALLEHGADPNVMERDGMPVPFLLNFSTGSPEILELLLRHNLDPNCRYLSKTLLEEVVAFGNEKSLQVLLSTPGINVNQSVEGDWNALCSAILHGKTTAVNELLRHGADPNWKSMYDRSVLAQAASLGRLDSLNLLLAYGADPAGSETWPVEPDVSHLLEQARRLRQGTCSGLETLGTITKK